MIGDKVVLYGKVIREGDLHHRWYWFKEKSTKANLLDGLGLVGFERYKLVEITIRGIAEETVSAPEVARVEKLV